MQVAKDCVQILLALCFGLIFMADTASAQTRELKELPQPKAMSGQEFEEKTVDIVYRNETDPAIAYQLRLPESWKEVPFASLKNYESDNKVFGDVGLYLSPVSSLGRARFEVQVHELYNEMYIEYWLIKRLLDQGSTLRSIHAKDQDQVEAVYVQFKDNVTYVAHTKAFINGPRIIQATFLVPVDRFEEMRDLQIHATRSFRFLVQDTKRVEELRSYAYLDQKMFDYPQSLYIQSNDVITEEELKLVILSQDQNGFPIGRFLVDIYAKTADFSLQQHVKDVLATLDAEGLVIKDKIEEKTYRTSDIVTFSSVEVYNMARKTSEYLRYEEDPITQELWMAILASPQYFMILSLVTPTREMDVFNWSRNTRAFEIIVSSYRD